MTENVHLLFFALIPIGIAGFVIGLKLVRKRFFGQVLAEVTLTQLPFDFTIKQSGIYALWYKSRLLTKVPLQVFSKFQLQNDNGKIVRLVRPFPLFRPYVNGFEKGRQEMSRFSAGAGTYQLLLEKGIPNGFSKNQRLQIRESQAAYMFLMGILLMGLCIACVVCGLVFGILTA